jgi:predicted enzyme related to lactoylglutathione lyase
VWHLLLEVLKRVQHDGGDIRDPKLVIPNFVILNLFQDPISVALTV